MDDITILIPVAPIPSHPDTRVIDQVINNLREYLPDSEILLMCDGVPSNKWDRKKDYDEHVQRLIWKCDYEWKKAYPIVFTDHHHQTQMTKAVLPRVTTPYLLFVEQDTPLVNDIPWEDLKKVLKSGYSNLIRLYHDSLILPEHQYLMLDDRPDNVLGVPLVRTIQWSQRPHLANTEFYRSLTQYWDGDPAFIEHKMYGILASGGWEGFRVHIYAPEFPMLRSLHLDGRREGLEEYDPSVS